MRATLILCALTLACSVGCSSNQLARPCGPGYLGNILIPQGFCGADFRPACRQHDRCYSSNCPRKACDDRFLDDMLGACQCSNMPGLCRLRAYQWYWQVRLLGWPGYLESQQQRGGCGGGCQACGPCGCGSCNACGGCAPQGCSSCGAPTGCCNGQAPIAEEAPLDYYHAAEAADASL
jgi:hypothetical protein